MKTSEVDHKFLRPQTMTSSEDKFKTSSKLVSSEEDYNKCPQRKTILTKQKCKTFDAGGSLWTWIQDRAGF